MYFHVYNNMETTAHQCRTPLTDGCRCNACPSLSGFYASGLKGAVNWLQVVLAILCFRPFAAKATKGVVEVGVLCRLCVRVCVCEFSVLGASPHVWE